MSLDKELTVDETRTLLHWLELSGLTAAHARNRDEFLEWHNGIFDAGVQEGLKSVLPPSPDEDITSLRLSNRVFNALERHGITVVKELLRHSRHDLHDISNIGKQNFDELMNRLAELGLQLAEEDIHSERKAFKQWGEPNCPIKRAALERRKKELRY